MKATLKGFTLIELSIVLVILGLIVGGVVGGQSLLHAARMQNVLRDYNGWVTAWNAFSLQYDSIPGDFAEGYAYFGNGSNASCGNDNTTVVSDGCNGDGNGMIDQYGEAQRAWMHLQKAEIIQGKIIENSNDDRYRQACPHDCTGDLPGVVPYNVPSTKGFEETTGWQWVNPLGPSNWCTPGTCNFYGRQGTFLWLGSYGFPAGVADYMVMPALSSRDASSIDKKMDDNIPTMGVVNAFSGHGFTNECASVGTTRYSQDEITPSDTHTYNLSASTVDCVLMFHIGN